MDKIKNYQNVIIAYFEELKSWQFSNDDAAFITDEVKENLTNLQLLK